jgi:molecular chaperone GrpE
MSDEFSKAEKDPSAAGQAAEASAQSTSADAQEASVVGIADAAPDTPVDPVAVAQAESAKLREQLLRTAADFDNFRKRSRKELTDAERRAREELLRDLLPVFDNLERASAAAITATDVKPVAEGVAMVMRQFTDTLGKLGVERIESVGKAFDPAVHEAIQQLETADFEPGCVAAEIQAGYRLGERLVRPAMVVVAKRPSS